MTNQNKEVFVFVLSPLENANLGVFSSKEELEKGVEYYMHKEHGFSDLVLSYTEFELNYSPEPMSWDYAYIPLSKAEEEKKHAIKMGISCFPIIFGENLIQLELNNPEEELFEELFEDEEDGV